MDTKIAALIVWQGKGYVPAHGQVVNGGPFAAVDPVFVIELDKDELLSAIRSAMAVGYPPLPNMTPKDWANRNDPILSATGARSWKELCRKGASYAITWSATYILLDMTRRDRNEKCEYDGERQRRFPPGTDLEQIVDAILLDIETRPELKHVPGQRKRG
jgi:hypothetical protein